MEKKLQLDTTEIHIARVHLQEILKGANSPVVTNKTKQNKTKNNKKKNPWLTEEIKGEIKKYLEEDGKKLTTIQNLWKAEKAVLRETLEQYTPTSGIKINLKQPNFIPKATQEKEQTNPKVSRRK